MAVRAIIDEQDVENCLQHRQQRLPFALEAAFRNHTRRFRVGMLRATVFQTIVVYNVFLLVDYLLLPTTFVLALAIHLCIVTPCILLAYKVSLQTSRHSTREVCAAGIPFIMAMQIIVIFSLNKGFEADQYQYLATMVVVFMNVSQRPSFKYAAAASIILGVFYGLVLITRDCPLSVKLIGASVMLACGYVTLMANKQMGLDQRFAFLRRLQDGFRRSAAETAAKQDPLTGVGNRRQLQLRMAELSTASQDRDHVIAILMIDVDNFKLFNDRYGHLAGDQCLRRVAAALAAELRGDLDLLVRYGGEEFLILLEQADLGRAVRLGERARRAIETLGIPHDGVPEGIVTVSVGATAGGISASANTELIDTADAALYAAKRAGRNQVWPPVGECINKSLPTPNPAAATRQKAMA